jgi:adenylate kinase family enzyme
MKIVVIGQSGAGKSTFARQLALEMGYPILYLDSLWHATDYSEAATIQFRQAQVEFMASHENWIVEGNYASSFDLRLPQADQIVLLKANRLTIMWRVITRSIKYRLNPSTRPEMAEAHFQEKWDKEYLEFLKWVWTFDKTQGMAEKLAGYDVMVLKTRKEKETYLNELKLLTS